MATKPYFSLRSDRGISNADGITNVGYIDLFGLPARATWRYSLDAGAHWISSSTLPPKSKGFSIDNGTYKAFEIKVEVTSSGVVTKATNTSTIVIDTVAPKTPLQPLVDGTSISSTANSYFTLSGAAKSVETGTSIQVFDGGKLLGTTTASSEGSWSLTPGHALPDGVHNITIKSVDTAGNISPATAVKVVTVDTNAWHKASGWGSLDVLAALNKTMKTHVEAFKITETNGSTVLHSAKFDAVHSAGYKGAGVKIAVIDTGIDTTNPQLNKHISADSWNFVDKNNVLTDSIGHGSKVASLITSQPGDSVVGGAYEAELMVLKIYGSTNADYVPMNLVRAINYAVDHHAKIISMSSETNIEKFGTSSDMLKALKHAQDNDVLIVAAAGNSVSDNLPFPANYAKTYSNVLAVGALGAATAEGASTSMASFSNLPGTDTSYNFINATGTDILTDIAINNNINTTKGSGTSLSTPLVASAAAVLLSANPSLHATDLVSLLTSTAHQVI